MGEPVVHFLQRSISLDGIMDNTRIGEEKKNMVPDEALDWGLVWDQEKTPQHRSNIHEPLQQ